jgi:hypothetical protein
MFLCKLITDLENKIIKIIDLLDEEKRNTVIFGFEKLTAIELCIMLKHANIL